MKKKIRKYIDIAGGTTVVARKLKLSRTTIWKWCYAGFPDTDHSGKTDYAYRLTKLVQDEGYDVTHEEMLKAGRP